MINTLLLWSDPFLMKVTLIGILGVSQEDSECADSNFYSGSAKVRLITSLYFSASDNALHRYRHAF